MNDAPAPLDPRSRSTYRAWTAIPVRFGDQDPLAHVNNVAIAAYFEHARCTQLIPALRASGAGTSTVIARITIDYLSEIHFPGTVDVGLRITRGRNKSFVISSGIFNGQACSATSEAVMVFFDTKQRATVTPSETVWATLAHLM